MNRLHQHRKQRNARPAQRRGLTLVEVVVSTLLTAFMLAVAMQAMAGSTLSWQASGRVKDGTGLAQQLMTEIMSQQYREAGLLAALGIDLPEILENRSIWDDVDDYDGLNNSPPRDRSGNALPGYSGWRAQVRVDYVKVASPMTTTFGDEGLKRIIVTVTDPAGRVTVLVGFRSRYGALEQAPAVDTTVASDLASEMQIGSATKLENGVNFNNHARGP
jgi:MSHA pilin protein MshD